MIWILELTEWTPSYSRYKVIGEVKKGKWIYYEDTNAKQTK